VRVRFCALLVALLHTQTRIARAVEGGTEDRVTTHAVSIATFGPSQPDVRCSGTLISPNVVLTVRHCIAPLPLEGTNCDKTFPEPSGAPGDYWVNATPWSIPAGTWKNVASWVLPEPKRTCGNDIALLVLSEAFGESEATPAVPVVSAERFEGR
jgi:hypothetical protein